MSWQFLYQDRLTTASIQHSLHALEKLDLLITSTDDVLDGGEGTNFLEGGALSRLISAAPRLQTLSVTFGGAFGWSGEGDEVDIHDVVGTSH